MPSFTVQQPDLREVGPVVDVRLALADAAEEILRESGQDIPTPILVSAQIDTGASGTVIRQEIADALGLQPVGITKMNTPSSTDIECYLYAVTLFFPNDVMVPTVAVGAPLQGQTIQCLIGRDVLSNGVLIYIGYANTFTLSF